MADIIASSLLILISAPSGGGKTTLCEQVLATNPNAVRAVTCTTRVPRDGEVDGEDYFFLDPATFLRRVEAGHFLEHALVYGNSYGTLKAEVMGKLRQSRDVLLSVDVQGAASIRQRAQDDTDLRRALVTVFITPPSIGVLEERLKKRAKDSPEVIRDRLNAARQEVAQWRHFDYLILSRSIADDSERMRAIITAEKMRHPRVPAPVFD